MEREEWAGWGYGAGGRGGGGEGRGSGVVHQLHNVD